MMAEKTAAPAGPSGQPLVPATMLGGEGGYNPMQTTYIHQDSTGHQSHIHFLPLFQCHAFKLKMGIS